MNQNTRKPTAGRIVNFHPNGDARFNGLTVALAAIIAYVHSEQMVNLTVFGPNGETYPVTSVSLMNDGFDITTRNTGDGCFAAWPDLGGNSRSLQRDVNDDAQGAQVFNAGGQVAGPGTVIADAPPTAQPDEQQTALAPEADTAPLDPQVSQEAPVPAAESTGPASEEVTGTNIHGLGPDTAGGPNPDYNPDA